MTEKPEIFLKILCCALLFNSCVGERYAYHTVGGHDLSSSVPLELYLLPADDNGVDELRPKRSLSSTVSPFAFEGADSVLNSKAPPHSITFPDTNPPPPSDAPAPPSSVGSIIPGLASNPTLADKPAKPSSLGGSGAYYAASNKSRATKKVLPGSEEILGVNAAGKKTYLSTPLKPLPPVNTTGAIAANLTVDEHNANLPGAITPNQAVDEHSLPPLPTSTSAPYSEDFGELPPDDLSNKTLAANNITSTTNDSHTYYNSSVSRDEARAKSLWVELNEHNSKTHDILSNAHRRAVTQKLSFDFPFYGHVVHNVTITTGGFLYTGEQTHPWLAATQFIAPLMANFDTSLTNDSVIRYLDTDSQLTVTWENVRLQDKPEAGGFTFQATLYKSGNIAFVYKSIPVVAIDDDHHPVKVGLSDSYVMDKTIFFVRRKTIYEYHRVQFSHTDISNWTSIYLTALPTCLDHKDCDSCLSDVTSQFTCFWCPTAQRCSTGLDRNRQDWVQKGCDRIMVTSAQYCSTSLNYAPHSMGPGGEVKALSAEHLEEMESATAPMALLPPNHKLEKIRQPQYTLAKPDLARPMGKSKGTKVTSGGDNRKEGEETAEVHKMTISSLFFTLLCLASFVGVVVWAVYAYNNPMSSSGQILIRYRPSQWTMKRGEARYTAATIHM
ncbi:hypothetical protein M8J77_024558 [Diaphorina citri]|nr:hypothetical protein M8J77_024558 [Diaphorina citri]